jgi:hypothetical protein
MNKIVRDHYPAAKLPEDLREGLPPGVSVRVSVEVESQHDACLTLEEIFALGRMGQPRTSDKIDADLRALRDEWQIRE